MDIVLVDVVASLANLPMTPKGLLSYISLLHEAVNLGYKSLFKSLFK